MNDHVSRQGDVPSLFCRVCKGSSLEPLDTCYGFDRSSETWILSGCRQCGVVSTTPFLSVSELATYYHADYYGGEENDQKSEAKFHPWLEWLVKLANGRRGLTGLRYLERSAIRHGLEPDRPLRWNLLDVGCGRGAFLKSLAQLGHRCTGTDITPFSSLATSGVTFLQGKLQDLQLPSESFDGIWIWHVLEHTTDPAETVEEISRLLRDDGIVAIAVPHFDSWQRRLFGRHWFHLDLPRHQFHFSRPALLRLLSSHGIQPFRVETMSWDQNIYGWIQSLQNVFFFRRFPNGLYSLLKRQGKGRDTSNPSVSLWLACSWFVLAGLTLLPAVIASLLEAMCGQGGTLIVHGAKVGSRAVSSEE